MSRLATEPPPGSRRRSRTRIRAARDLSFRRSRCSNRFSRRPTGFWERRIDGHLSSEPIVVTEAGGANLPLTVVAVVLRGRRYLVLQRLAGFDDRQHILQRARERALEHEDVVKRIDSMRRPAATLARLAAELQDMGVGEPARKHLDAMTATARSAAKAARWSSRRCRAAQPPGAPDTSFFPFDVAAAPFRLRRFCLGCRRRSSELFVGFVFRRRFGVTSA